MKPQDLPPIITIDEAAELLRCDRKTLYGMAKRKKLPGCRRVGRCFRIHRDTLLQSFGAEHSHSPGR